VTKKILIAVAVLIVVGGVIGLTVMRAQSGYTKVITGKVVRQDLASVVSGTGQIKPKTYVNRDGKNHPPLCQRGRPREEG